MLCNLVQFKQLSAKVYLEVKIKMKCLFWLFVTIHIFCNIAASSAEPVRPKRDLARIQNFINWLLGVPERNLIQTVPIIENEHERIYTIPAYQKLLVRTIPRTEINDDMRYLLAEGLYPRKTLRPVQAIRNYKPILYDNHPPVMQEYINDRAYGHYRYGRPLYPYVNQVPTYKEIVPPLCPVSVTKLEACDYDTRAIVTETRQPLPQPPLLIRNRIREVILNHSKPTVKLQEDIVMRPEGSRKVDVSKYFLIDDRRMKNEASVTKDVVITEERLKAIPILPLKIEPENEENKLKTNSDSNIKKKVTFTAPVHTNYKYKMIYHNQPQKNTVVEMDSFQSQTEKSKEDTSTLRVNESTDKINNPSPLKAMEDKVSSNYIFVPPISTDIPPPGNLRVNMNMESANSDNNSASASDNRAIVVMDESPFTNAGNKNKPTRVIVRRRKLKSPPENGRGDIPENSS